MDTCECLNCGQHYATEPAMCGVCHSKTFRVTLHKGDEVLFQVKKPCCGDTGWKPTIEANPAVVEEVEKMRADAQHMLEEGAGDAAVGLQQEANELEQTENVTTSNTIN